MLNIVLYQPEIPFNTGAIGRTCVASGSALHLIKPLGFSLEEKAIRRTGLDYWPLLDLHVYEDYQDFLDRAQPKEVYYVTTKGGRVYTELSYTPETFFVFGRESAGLPKALLEANPECCLRIPMAPEIRSLNLSNTVAILVYEGLRQQGFAGLTCTK